MAEQQPEHRGDDKEQRIRLLEARLHSQERALKTQRGWTIAIAIVIVVRFALYLLFDVIH